MKSRRHEVWEQVLELLRARLGERRGELWLNALHLVPDADEPPVGDGQPVTYTLAVETPFARKWFTERFLGDIQAAFAAVDHAHVRVEVIVDPTKVPPAASQVNGEKSAPEANGRSATTAAEAAPRSVRPRPADPREDGQPLNARYTLERFVPGRASMIAYRSAVEVLHQPGKLYNPLVIYGDSGVGKSHLIQAIACELRRGGRRVVHASCEFFVNEFVHAVTTRDTASLRRFRESTRTADALVVDDVHLLRNKTATQDEFLHFFDAFLNSGRQIVLASDTHPRLIKRLKKELATRFMAGMVVRLEPPDIETRLAILRRKAAETRLEFPEDVLRMLAATAVSSVRELEGLLVRVAAQASLDRARPDMELARVALRDLADTRVQPINLRTIETAIVEYFRITPEELRSNKRRKSVTLPRQVAMYLARTLTQASLQEIGNFFGGRNHATVHFAERKISAARRSDATVDELCEKLVARFRPTSEDNPGA